MAYNSKIEWTDATWNPIAGCTKCSPGCLNCYAERMAIRLNGIFAAKGDNNNWAKMSNILKWDYSEPELYEFGKAVGWNGEVELFINRLDQPLHWRKPCRIFVCSMSDLFHEKVPFSFINKVFDMMYKCPQHTFLVLTKRPEQILSFVGEKGEYWHTIPNVHIGVSISTQAEMWKVKVLTDIPAAVKFISFEPLLENITDINTEILERLDGAIIGCESGPNRRECKNEWVKELVEDFHYFNKPVFVKQISVNGKVVKMPKDFPQELPKVR